MGLSQKDMYTNGTEDLGINTQRFSHLIFYKSVKIAVGQRMASLTIVAGKLAIYSVYKTILSNGSATLQLLDRAAPFEHWFPVGDLRGMALLEEVCL